MVSKVGKKMPQERPKMAPDETLFRRWQILAFGHGERSFLERYYGGVRVEISLPGLNFQIAAGVAEIKIHP